MLVRLSMRVVRVLVTGPCVLGAWVVHSSRQRGSPVEVLSAANERSLLKQLPRDRRKERIEKIEEKTVKV